MENSFKKIFIVAIYSALSVTSTPINAKANPTDIVGRDLDIRGAGWAGHVGIVTDNQVTDAGNYVVEALWEPLVLQINSLSNFKRRSPYWGAKYGINQNNTTGTKIINEGAFQTSLKCAEYTLSVYYKPGSGQWGVPYVCPKFRCDTFVTYLYWWGGYTLPTYNPPETSGNATIPAYVFNYFPFFRVNSVKANEPIQHLEKIPSVPLNEQLSINDATVEQLESLSIQEFYQAVDIPISDLTSKGIDNIVAYSIDLTLSKEKRLFLLDKLGFVVTPKMLPKLIELYQTYKNDEAMSHMIIRDTQDLYQQFDLLTEYSNEKEMLQKFYSLLLDTNLSTQTASVVVRGFIALSPASVVFTKHNEIDNIINNSELDKSISMSLKIALFFKSTDLEKLYVSNIIDNLVKEDSAELNTLFFGAVAAKLGANGIDSIKQETKSLLSAHLNSIHYKFIPNSMNKTSGEIILPQSLGIWLEASALINSSSLQEAGKYIAVFLSQRSLKEQKNYVQGFSNNQYLQNSFNMEPSLIQFKRQHTQFYNDTVGLAKR